MPATKWNLRPVPDDALAAVLRCQGACELPPLVQRLLALRGLGQEEEIESYLRPSFQLLSDPFLLPDMRAAVDRILQAVDKNETVVLYGDYDVDGVTSLTILKLVLRAFGLDVKTFLPHRMDEGYGLSEEGLRRCLSECQPNLVLAVDCGTSSRKEIAWLKDQGIDAIVLDHHSSAPETIPLDTPVVNPKRGDAFHYLCSAGMAFKLGHALMKARRVDFDLRSILDLVAVGTVADVVPLVDENRLFVRKGLQFLARTKHLGLQALKKAAAVNGSPTSADIGFRLGPRLNAAGRLDTAQAALDLLLCENQSQAAAIAEELDGHNRDRQTMQRRIEGEAEAMLHGQFQADRDCSIVLASDAWHPGVVGIVASKVCRRHHRPTIIIAFDEDGVGKGSGRSVEGISLVQALDDCRDLLLKGGGHDMAAGLTIRRENLDAFRLRFAESVRRHAPEGSLIPKLHLDAEVGLDELDFDLLTAYELLEPFGTGNSQPLLFARGVIPAVPVRLLKEKHRRFVLSQNGTQIPAMWFDSASRELPPPPWDVAFTVQRGEFRGEEQLDVTITGLRAAQ